MSLILIAFLVFSSPLALVHTPQPAQAAPVAPQCTALPNNNASNELAYTSMYVSNMVANSESPTPERNDRSVVIAEMYTHGDKNNAYGEQYDPNARYYEATFNPESFLTEEDANQGHYTQNPFFNFYVSKGWRIDPRVFIDVYSGVAGYNNVTGNLVVNSQLYDAASSCPPTADGQQLDCKPDKFLTWPDFANNNPLLERGSDAESLDSAVFYHYDDPPLWALNTFMMLVGGKYKDLYYADPGDYPDYSVIVSGRNYRWTNYRNALAARMEDGSDPAKYPFIGSDGVQRQGYFGDPKDKGAFMLNLAKSIGGSFSFRYNSQSNLSQKAVKVRFKVTRDPKYQGNVPFFVGGSLKSYDKNVDFNRSVFKFDSPYSQVKNYPIKVTHRVYESVEAMNQGRLKADNFGPPQHQLKFSFQGAGDIPAQTVNYPRNNPVDLCYYYATKRKTSSITDPFSLRIHTTNGQEVPLTLDYNPFTKEYKLRGEYPAAGGKKIPFIMVPSLNYAGNSSNGEPRYGALRPHLHPYESRWTINWIDPDTVKLNKFTIQVPKEQKVISPRQTVNPRIRVLDTANRPYPKVQTRPVITRPDKTEDLPHQNGIASANDGYLRVNNNFMPYSNTQQQGRYRVSVKDYKINHQGNWLEPTAEMLEPSYDDFVVSDKAQNLVADHYFQLTGSNYVWNVEKDTWVGKKLAPNSRGEEQWEGQWVNTGEIYRNGGQPGQEYNLKGTAFPNKFRLKVSVVYKADAVSVVSGSATVRYFPKPGAPESVKITSPTVTIADQPNAQCQVTEGAGASVRAFERIQIKYSCYIPASNLQVGRVNPQINLNTNPAVKVFNYTENATQSASASADGQKIITLRDRFTDNTINRGSGVDINLAETKFKGTWCADPSENRPTCESRERLDRLQPSMRSQYRNQKSNMVLEAVKKNQPVLSYDFMRGVIFGVDAKNAKHIQAPFDTRVWDQLGTLQENGRYINNSRVIYYLYEIPSTTEAVTWKKREQLLTNNAYVCSENYDSFNGFTPNASTSCRLAIGSTSASTQLKIIDDFEDVLVRIRRSDTMDNLILNSVGQLHYDPSVCTNAEAVRRQKPAMLASITDAAGTPSNLSAAQSGACYLPMAGSKDKYTLPLASAGVASAGNAGSAAAGGAGEIEVGYSDGKYALKEKSALLGSLLLPEGIPFEISGKKFYWLNQGGTRSAEQPDNLAYVTEETVDTPVGNGVKEKRKAYTITLLDMRRATLPATGGFGVYAPALLGAGALLGFAFLRRRSRS